VGTDPKEWIGRTEAAADTLHPERVAALWATLDRDGPAPADGAPLPPLWHWLYFWTIARRGDLGRDGHPRLGGFLPDLEGVRRMWAGSRVELHRPLTIGTTVTRRSTIENVAEKHGRTGRLVFVTVRHEIADAAGLAITDLHDIVYRALPGPPAPPPRLPAQAAATAARVERWTADPTLLFRYSALTFNGHRIHYDQAYATGTEGYPGLVVHGPLLATLMAGAATALRPSQPLTRFSFRAMATVFAAEPFTVLAEPDGHVWVRRADGGLAADGEAGWAG
jgi:3-methylfumaryl-CoA hydratase